jgi:hypothetical protein
MKHVKIGVFWDVYDYRDQVRRDMVDPVSDSESWNRDEQK